MQWRLLVITASVYWHFCFLNYCDSSCYMQQENAKTLKKDKCYSKELGIIVSKTNYAIIALWLILQIHKTCARQPILS